MTRPILRSFFFWFCMHKFILISVSELFFLFGFVSLFFTLNQVHVGPIDAIFQDCLSKFLLAFLKQTTKGLRLKIRSLLVFCPGWMNLRKKN